jgi:TolB-like protein/Flp pilus assembly protein TadD
VMLAGHVPFSGSASGVMDQQQPGPLPLEQLKDLPQPLLVLLQLLLEKDPAQRIQSPAELLKAIQAVAAAVDTGRSVTAQDLEASSVGRWTALQKNGKFQQAFKALFISSRANRLAWLVAGLLIAGLVILAVNGFLRVNQPSVKSAATSSIPIAVPEKSIAVLPFESLSENKSDTYFADGVQDEILSKLAKLSQLKVISRTSVMVYRDRSNRDVRAIAAALGVAHLVEGTVRRDSNRVRITTELIDARTDETLWSESYQRDLADIFAIQSEIAQAVALKLSASLSPQEQKNIAQRPTTNLEAYDLYIQAKALVSDRQGGSKPGDLAKAIKLLVEATQKDPKFTLAYCILARAHDDLHLFPIDRTPERLALADAAVNEALRLGPDSPEAHLALAYHLYCTRNYERASVQIELAQRALPNSPGALWLAARIDERRGRWDEATEVFEKAYSLDPRNPDIIYELADNYHLRGRYGESQQILGRLNEVDPAFFAEPSKAPFVSYRFWPAVWYKDWTAAKQILDESSAENLLVGGRVKVSIPRQCGEIWLAALQGKRPKMEAGFAAAREELAQRVAAYPDDVELLSVLGELDAYLGLKQEAIEEATRAVELRPISKDAVEGPFILWELAIVYTWTNEPDLAFREWAILAKEPSGLNKGDLGSPFFDPIRKDPRFDQLAAQLPE